MFGRGPESPRGKLAVVSAAILELTIATRTHEPSPTGRSCEDDWETDSLAVLEFQRELEKCTRMLEAVRVRAADRSDATEAFRADGHRTAKASIRHLGKLTGGEAGAVVSCAKGLRVLPRFSRAFALGEIPVAHARRIGRLCQNPRIAEFLPSADKLFSDHARTLPYEDFQAMVARWEQLADPDGADDAATRAFDKRDAWFAQGFDGEWVLHGTTNGIVGAAQREIFDAYVEAQTLADWQEARERVGPNATEGDLRRTAKQRRADALFAIFSAAADAGVDPGKAVPIVNVIVSKQEFEDELIRQEEPGNADPDPTRAPESVCETIDGTPITAKEAVEAALAGMVRRVVVDPQHRIINFGRSQRLFRGAAREALLLTNAIDSPGGVRCTWPGCNAGRRSLQADHVLPFAKGGRTDQDNGAMPCAYHNRLKEKGFRPVRDPDGRWQFYRPDGQPITPAA